MDGWKPRWWIATRIIRVQQRLHPLFLELYRQHWPPSRCPVSVQYCTPTALTPRLCALSLQRAALVGKQTSSSSPNNVSLLLLMYPFPILSTPSQPTAIAYSYIHWRLYDCGGVLRRSYRCYTGLPPDQPLGQHSHPGAKSIGKAIGAIGVDPLHQAVHHPLSL